MIFFFTLFSPPPLFALLLCFFIFRHAA